jgi:hypothetical protein
VEDILTDEGQEDKEAEYHDVHQRPEADDADLFPGKQESVLVV